MDDNNNYSSNTPLMLTRDDNSNRRPLNPVATTEVPVNENRNEISSGLLGNNVNKQTNENKEPLEVTQKKKSNLRLFILFLVLDLAIASLIVYEVVTLFMKVAAGEI